MATLRSGAAGSASLRAAGAETSGRTGYGSLAAQPSPAPVTNGAANKEKLRNNWANLGTEAGFATGLPSSALSISIRAGTLGAVTFPGFLTMFLPLRKIGLAAVFAATLAASAAAQTSGFSDKTLGEEAQRYEAALKQAVRVVPGRAARDLRRDAERLAAIPGHDARQVVLFYQQSIVAEAGEADSWLGLARSLLAMPGAILTGNERNEVPQRAASAAYRAYERAKTPVQRASALQVAAEAQKRRSRNRSALTLLTQSLSLVENPQTRAVYDALRAEHGFRITDSQVDADAATPRACVVFSEQLASGQVDWAKFIRIDGREAQAVIAEDKQLCVEGLSHGRGYKLEVRAGLPSVIANEQLLKSSELSVYVRDRSPSVRTGGRAYVLPASGQQGVPLTTTNVDAVAVQIYRIGDRSLASLLQSGDFQRQVARYDLEQIKERTGEKIYEGELSVEKRLNEEVTTAFPVSEALKSLKPGVYVLAAQTPPKKDRDGRSFATQWFIVSDLGITTFTGQDGVHTFVRSLATAAPIADTEVRLIARNNEVLGTMRTDAKGYARFDGGLARGEGGLAPAFVSAETRGGDYAFLDMTVTAFDLSDRGVKGRAAPGAIDAFAYTDRGVYRPGETVHLTTLVRDRNANAAGLPVTAIVTRPDGVEHRRVVLTDQSGLGGRALALQLADGAQSGTWRAKIHVDPKAAPIAQTAFLVEDFVPERLDLKLDAQTPSISQDDGVKIKIAGRYLYGPPAADLAVEGDIFVKQASGDLTGFPGYVFGRSDERIIPSRKALESLGETGADGTAVVDVSLPQVDKTQHPLTADVILKLRESGGRTIERKITLPVDLKIPRVGIKPGFSGGSAPEDDVVKFEVVQLNADSKPVAAQGVKWTLLRLSNTWQWYNRGGDWTYEQQVVSRKVASGSLDLAADAPGRLEAKVGWGRYRLEVTSGDGATMSSYTFTAGYFQDEEADSPEVLEVGLDKPIYRAGEVAKVRVSSRAGGRAMVAVLGSGIEHVQEVDLPAGGGEIPLTVAPAFAPGAYVTVTLYRPLDTKEKRMPGRAVGLKWLTVDPEARTLKVALAAPEKVKPGTRLDVPVSITGLAAGEEARVTIAATDVGILNLTRFDPPKPEGWFFGQRKLGLDMRDYYARLIDGMRADRGRLRSGGDGSDGTGMSSTGSPPVEATLALFSGIVTVDRSGRATVSFDMPDFNGTVRLSAVAWSAQKIGSGSRDVVVRDAVALTAAAPRFLTLGDEARLQLDVHNVDGAAGTYALALSPRGQPAAALASRPLPLKAGEKRAETITLKPSTIGPWPLDVVVTGPNGLTVKRQLTFDVKAPHGDIRRVTVSELKGNGGKLTLSRDIFQDLLPGTERATVHVGPLASLDVPGLLNQLDRYPYGCAEQTTSRALPLLYANDIARQLGLGQDREIRARVEKAIERVLEMQDSSGAFGIWGPSDGDIWLTSYVTDFLLRAKEAGYAVEARALSLALERLQNYVGFAADFEKGGEDRAYALYVLARGGKAPVGEIRYYVDARLDRFSTTLALAQLGAAAQLVGDRPRAEASFNAALKKLDAAANTEFRRDYGSGLRDGAALVTLASETRMSIGEVPKLLDVVAKAYSARPYTSTQEQAWLLLAARAIAQQASGETLTVGGQRHSGKLIRSLRPDAIPGEGLTIANTADNPTTAVLSVLGSSMTPEPAISKGFTVERNYYTLDGKKVDLKSATGGASWVKQNDRFVVVVKVEAPVTGGRILLVDRLPAGFEIENPRLVESGDVKSFDWLETKVKPEHTEFRDDRFVAAFDFFGRDSSRRRRNGDDDDSSGNSEPASAATVAYMVRAVTPGVFLHPAATVEDMYRPDRYARTAAGKLTVVAK